MELSAAAAPLIMTLFDCHWTLILYIQVTLWMTLGEQYCYFRLGILGTGSFRVYTFTCGRQSASHILSTMIDILTVEWVHLNRKLKIFVLLIIPDHQDHILLLLFSIVEHLGITLQKLHMCFQYRSVNHFQKKVLDLNYSLGECLFPPL